MLTGNLEKYKKAELIAEIQELRVEIERLNGHNVRGAGRKKKDVSDADLQMARKKPKMEYIIDGHTGFLFLDDKGKPMKAYQWEKKFKYSVDKYNSIYKEELPKITPHIARHTYCTNLVKRQVSVKTAQYLLGHADVSTTLNIYTHIKLEDAKTELEELAMREELKKMMSETGALEAKKELKRMRCV